MKKILFRIGLPLLLFPCCMQGQSRKSQKKQFFPLQVGNYWVYTNPDMLGNTDTIWISETKIVDSNTVFNYNGQLLFERNDTVFSFQYQRGGSGFPSVQYFPATKKTTYSIVVGGDAVTQRTVRKVKHPYTCEGRTYQDCYEYRRKVDNGYEYIIISRGVGIVEINYPGRITRLVSFKIN